MQTNRTVSETQMCCFCRSGSFWESQERNSALLELSQRQTGRIRGICRELRLEQCTMSHRLLLRCVRDIVSSYVHIVIVERAPRMQVAFVNDLYTMYFEFLIFYSSLHQQHFSFQFVSFQLEVSGSYFSDIGSVSFLNHDAYMSVADFLCVYVISCFAVYIRQFTVFPSYFHFCDG